ncbi:MAG: hypothetical protein JJE53_03365 [Candidatus Pacebacteria bacterium]|nr:hypothetical protein [Candidatus Paceibacterota bacterium]
MKVYIPNVFYNPESVIPVLDEFKKEVQELSYNILLEQKYVKGRWREPTDKSLEWILDMCKKNDNVKIVHIMPNWNIKECLQVVFITMLKEGWYLAWCDMEIEYEHYLIKKYKLVVL